MASIAGASPALAPDRHRAAAGEFCCSQDGEAGWTEARLRWAAYEHDHGFPPSFCRVARRYAARLGLELFDPLYAVRAFP